MKPPVVSNLEVCPDRWDIAPSQRQHLWGIAVETKDWPFLGKSIEVYEVCRYCGGCKPS